MIIPSQFSMFYYQGPASPKGSHCGDMRVSAQALAKYEIHRTVACENGFPFAGTFDSLVTDQGLRLN
jgi:hypothetical protein